MCTERIPTLALALSLLLSATVAARADEDAAREWWNAPSRVCLWLVVDGLRASALEGPAPWDGALMPHLAARRDDCLRFENVWAELDDDTGSLAQLISGLSPIAALAPSDSPPAPPQLQNTRLRRTRGIDETLAALDEAAASNGRWLVVARVDELRFPLQLDVETLRVLDPRPWADAPSTPVEMEWIERKRLRQAIDVAGEANPLRTRMSNHSLEIYRWVVQAGHRELDADLERLLLRMQRADLDSRGGWILSAPRALALDRHGLDQPGTGAVLDRLHVPLWWHFPPSAGLRGSRSQALVNRDLAKTLRAWNRDESGATLFGPGETERFAFVSGQRQLGRSTRPWAHLRWSTPEFTLLDLVSSPRRIELYDRRLDPDELHTRGAASQALWDSLRTQLMDRMLGETATLECSGSFAAGQAVELLVSAPPAEIEALGGHGVELLASGGRTRVRWRPSGDGSRPLRLVLPAAKASLQLTRGGIGAQRVQLGAHSIEVPPTGSLDVAVGSRLFADMLQEPPEDDARIRLRWMVGGWWVAP